MQLPDPIGSTRGVGVGPEWALTEEVPACSLSAIVDSASYDLSSPGAVVFCD